MEAFVRTLGCSTCGGALALHRGQRVVTCPYCGRRKLAVLDGIAPRFVARSTMTAVQARSEMLAAVEDPELPRDLAASLRLAKPRLFMVPFYEMTAQRFGTAVLRREELVSAGAGAGAWAQLKLKGMSSRAPAPLPKVQTRSYIDTKVLMTQSTFTAAGVDLPGWGLERIVPATARSEGSGYRALEGDVSDAIAFEPTQSIEGFQKKMADSAALGAGDSSQFAEQRTVVLYYPVWRATYWYGGRGHRVGIDGITGALLSAEAPTDAKRGLLTMLLAAALAGGIAAFVGVSGFDFARDNASPVASVLTMLALPLAFAGATAAGFSVARTLMPPSQITLPRSPIS